MLHRPPALLLALYLQACSASRPSLLLPEGDGLRAVAAGDLILSHPLPEGRNIHPVSLGHTEALSYHLVQIEDREAPHLHARHDLTVTLLRGHGELHAGGAIVPMRAGDTAVVPRGLPHHFVNLGSEPAAAFVTFAPPFDGSDNVPTR